MNSCLSALASAALLLAACTSAAPPVDDRPAIDLVVSGGTVLTMAGPNIPNGAVAIDDGAIVAVAPAAEIDARYAAADRIDARGGAILPGLVNAHTHVPMTLFRGLADDRDLMDWLQNYIFPAEARNVDAEFVRWGTRLGLAEMIRTGTTTFADMYYFEAVIGREAKAAGVRAVVGETLIDFPAPDNKTWDEAIAYARGFAEEFRNDPLITPALAPHAPFTVSREHLLQVRRLATELGVPILIHVAETEAEVEQVSKAQGLTPVAYLDSIGFLADDVVMAHTVHLTQDEVGTIARADAGAVHSPESNMMLASGVAPVPALLADGVDLGLGTDGPAGSNNDLDMVAEMASAARLQKISRGDPRALTARQVLEVATIGGARALDLDAKIGTLEPGKRADVIVIDLSEPGTQPVYSVESAIVYATSGEHVTTTIVDGRVLMRDRRLLTVDADAAVAKAQEYRDRVVASLGATAPPAPAPTPPVAAERKVVLVSFDGVGWAELESISPQLGGEGWNRIVREGAASRVVPVSPTLTAVTHVSIATGADPQETGVISNSLHRPGGGPDAWMSGFEAEIETDTIWEAARRAGKRVGAITYPGLDATDPRRTADFGLVYVQPVDRSRFENLDAADFTETAAVAGTFRPPLVARITWRWSHDDLKIEQPVELVAIDTTNDGVANYDDFLVRHEGSTFDVPEDRWFPVSTEIAENGSPHLFGSWSRIESFEPDLDQVVVYWGAVSRNVGYPESYRRMIDEEAGFWPGPPDERNAARWLSERRGIQPETFIAQVERFSDFFTRATLVSMERMEWDLLLAYQPVVDETEHQWHLVSAEQQWSTPENLAASARVRAAAYAAFDGAVERLIGETDDSATLVVVSDHGMMPLHTGFRIGKLLAEWGLVEVEDGRIAPSSRWGVFTSGGFAHFHHFGDDPAADTQELIRRLSDVRFEGEPVFESIRASTPGDHPAMGQVQAYLHPGFAFISGTSGETFEKTRYFGQHGYLPQHRPLHPIFGAWGAAASAPFPDVIEQTSIAAWVAGALGIAPPRDAE